MAKRSRRTRKAKAGSQHGRTPRVQVRVQIPFEPAEENPSAGGDPRDEYRYVFTDLRRVAILAAGMFALLIALSFLLR